MSCKFEEPESMKKMFLQAVLCTVQYICMLEAYWFITTIRNGKGLGENKKPNILLLIFHFDFQNR